MRFWKYCQLMEFSVFNVSHNGHCAYGSAQWAVLTEHCSQCRWNLDQLQNSTQKYPYIGIGYHIICRVHIHKIIYIVVLSVVPHRPKIASLNILFSLFLCDFIEITFEPFETKFVGCISGSQQLKVLTMEVNILFRSMVIGHWP